MADPREYLYFYLIGRRDDELPCELDLALLADQVLDGSPIREVAYRAARDAHKAAEINGFKRDWLENNKSEIEEAGGDEGKAYALYSDGQVDELATELEQEVLGEVQALLDVLEISDRARDKDKPDDDV